VNVNVCVPVPDSVTEHANVHVHGTLSQ